MNRRKIASPALPAVFKLLLCKAHALRARKPMTATVGVDKMGWGTIKQILC